MTPEQLKRFELIKILFEREKGRCFYCDQPVSLEARIHILYDIERARKLRAATIDHLIPRSRRGPDSPDNCVCACVACNNDRDTRPAIDFLYEKLAGI